MTERMIKPVDNNKEKQETYRYQLGRYKHAIKEGFYYEALIIVYALLEDRLRSFLYYCGILPSRNNMKINKKIKSEIQSIMCGEIPTAKTMSGIKNKIRYVIYLLNWSENVFYKEIEENQFYVGLKSQIEYLDIAALIDVLYKLAKEKDGWLAYRNEVIHASMNKNVISLYENLSDKVEEGMEYARFIDSQTRILKQKGKVRKILKLQNN